MLICLLTGDPNLPARIDNFDQYMIIALNHCVSIYQFLYRFTSHSAVCSDNISRCPREASLELANLADAASARCNPRMLDHAGATQRQEAHRSRDDG